ncbi:MAG: cupin domain-containing protein [Planctomycetota bacterium]|jgi:quercetin dioxygenase-like cupin family protein
MIIKSVSDIPPESMEDLQGVEMRVAIGRPEKAPRFVLRHFTLDVGCATPRHSHWWEHEIYVIAGAGEAWTGSEYRSFQGGDTIYVPPDHEHEFKNTGDEPLKFICVIPHTDG